MKKTVLFLIGLLFLAACQPVDTRLDENTAVPTTQPIEVNVNDIPPVDTSIASVPLDEIYFDTFRATNRAVPLSVADEELILQLRDAIPPLYNPKFESAAEADKSLSNQDLVIGYADGDEAYAYPVKIMNFHEIVRHTVNGRPILATYCPLCQSGVVYDPTINGDVLIFGNTSALYESDMVMLDHQTGSYWVQVSGEAIVGQMTGTRLTPLPSQTTTWALWLAQYPHTFVLSQDTGYTRNYNRDPFARSYAEQLNLTGQFAFPVSEAGRDKRLGPGDQVLGIEIDGQVRVYPLDEIQDGVIHDRVGQTAVVIFVQDSTGAAFKAQVDERDLTFKWTREGFQDEQTGSIWQMNGTALSGELAGTQLIQLPSRASLWFAMIAAYPELELIRP